MSSDVARLARFVTLANKQEQQRDLQLPAEMNAAVGRMLSASDDGYLLDHVGCPLAAPLTSEAVFSPTAALLASKYARVKEDALIVPSPVSAAHDTLSREEYPSSVEPFAMRLNALWLKRHAKVGVDRRQPIAALSTWEQASGVLADRNCEGNFREIDNELVFDNFFNYDVRIHTAASTVQHKYKKRFKLRTRSAIRISTAYRCFIAHKKFQALLRLRDHSATLIQLQFRAYWRLLSGRAKKMQRWYHALRLSWVGWLARKQRLSSTRIQAWWRCVYTRWKYLHGRAMAKASAIALQRHARGYLGRDGFNGLNLVRRFRHYRVINRHIRGKLARSRVARLWEEFDRFHSRQRQQEADCMSYARCVTARLDFSAYASSKAGQHHFKLLRKRLKLYDSYCASSPAERESKMLEHFIQTSFGQCDINGTGQLSDDQMKQLLRVLKLPPIAAKELQNRKPMEYRDVAEWLTSSEHRTNILTNIRQHKYTAYRERAEAIVRTRFQRRATEFAEASFRERQRAGIHECCVCHQTFHRFRPYYWHIRDGCAETGTPSMFYSPFSRKGGPNQRDAEITVRFLQDQRSHLQQALEVACYQASCSLHNRYFLLWRYRHVLAGLAAGFNTSSLVENWRQLHSASGRAPHLVEVVASQLVDQLEVDDSNCIPMIVCEYAAQVLGVDVPPVWSELEHVPVAAVHQWVAHNLSQQPRRWGRICEELALLRLRVLLLSRVVCEASVAAALEFVAVRAARPSAWHCDAAEYNEDALKSLMSERFDVDKTRRRMREINDEWEFATHQGQYRAGLPMLRTVSALWSVRVAPETPQRIPVLMSWSHHHPQLRSRVKRLSRLRIARPDWEDEEGLIELLWKVPDAGSSKEEARLQKWNAFKATAETQRCLSHFAHTKSSLIYHLLNLSEDEDTEHCRQQLTRLLYAEQFLKHTGVWDLLEKEAYSHAQRAMRTEIAQGYLFAEKSRLQCIREVLQNDRLRAITHALDCNHDGWLNLAEIDVLEPNRDKLHNQFPPVFHLRQLRIDDFLGYLRAHSTFPQLPAAKPVATAHIVAEHQRRAYRATLLPGLQIHEHDCVKSILQVSCEAATTRLSHLFLRTPFGIQKLQAESVRCREIWEDLQASDADRLGRYLFSMFCNDRKLHANEARRLLVSEWCATTLENLELFEQDVAVEAWECLVREAQQPGAATSCRNFDRDARMAVLARLRQQATSFRETARLPHESELYECCFNLSVDYNVQITPEVGDVGVTSIEALLQSREHISSSALPYVFGALGFSSQEQHMLHQSCVVEGPHLPTPQDQIPVEVVTHALDAWVPKRWEVWRARSWRAITVPTEAIQRAAAAIHFTDRLALLDGKLATLVMEIWDGVIKLSEELSLPWD